MKTVDYPCEHGYYGICPQCVREERNELRTRVAELERERDKLQDALAITRNACASRKAQRDEYRRMAECAAIMAVCGYFSRMRGPDLQVAYKQFGGGCTRRFLKSEDAVRVHRDEGYEMTPLYAGSAPVPAAQSVDIARIISAYKCGMTSGDCINQYAHGTPEHKAFAFGVDDRGNMDWQAAQAEARVADDAPLSSVDARYRDLLNRLGCNGHDGAIAEINLLRRHLDEQAAHKADVDAICNAYESGVGHRGRPTANVNPYREGTPEHEAYAIGAKGDAAQTEAKAADDVVLLPAEATDEMQDNMRQALIDQGWESDSAGEVDFADLWHAGVYEYQERTADMLAAKAKGGGKENLTTAGQEAVLVEIFHGTRDALNKLSVFPSKDKP